MSLRCPCHSGLPYAKCCQPLHEGVAAPTARALMQSRYSAYVFKLSDYLLNTWHHSTRPAALTDADLQGIKWLSLNIIDASSKSTDLNHFQHDFVTFKARYKQGKGKTLTMHETSRFVFENAQWFYVDGEIYSS